MPRTIEKVVKIDSVVRLALLLLEAEPIPEEMRYLVFFTDGSRFCMSEPITPDGVGLDDLEELVGRTVDL